MNRLLGALSESWYRPHWATWLLAPGGWVWCAGARLKEAAYRSALLPVYRAPVPVLVVGNITVGGTGKTPLVWWLAELLGAHGYRPGIVCRGYPASPGGDGVRVEASSDPDLVGDEALMLASRGSFPVVAGRDRPAVVARLLREEACDVVVADDGLQHLALHRDAEIAVLDGRRLGNGRCLPAGPLREGRGRLHRVDWVVVNGEARPGEIPMRLRMDEARSLAERGRTRPLTAFAGEVGHAVAGIGDPRRFFDALGGAGIAFRQHPFPDHHAYRAADLAFAAGETVLMTEKDAVKCGRFAQPQWWYVPVRAELPESFAARVLGVLREVSNGRKTA